MDRIRCIIIDDEPLALHLLKDYLLRTPFLELVGEYSSAIDAMASFTTTRPQLIFLDIQMPDLTGLQLSNLIDKEIKIVFTTAYSNYALEGFKVDALDYLLKPFNYEEFLKASLKAKEWFEMKSQLITSKKSDFIFVRSEYKQIKINLSDILYFEGLKDYVKIFLASHQKPILTLMSLKTFEEELPQKEFMRIHRSFIISVAKIDAIEKGQVVIQGRYITIADQYKEMFNTFLNSSSFGISH